MALSEMMFHVVPPMVIYGQTWGKPMQKPMGQQKKKHLSLGILQGMCQHMGWGYPRWGGCSGFLSWAAWKKDQSCLRGKTWTQILIWRIALLETGKINWANSFQLRVGNKATLGVVPSTNHHFMRGHCEDDKTCQILSLGHSYEGSERIRKHPQLDLSTSAERQLHISTFVLPGCQDLQRSLLWVFDLKTLCARLVSRASTSLKRALRLARLHNLHRLTSTLWVCWANPFANTSPQLYSRISPPKRFTTYFFSASWSHQHLQCSLIHWCFSSTSCGLGLLGNVTTAAAAGSATSVAVAVPLSSPAAKAPSSPSSSQPRQRPPRKTVV